VADRVLKALFQNAKPDEAGGLRDALLNWAPDATGNTALHIAVKGECPEFVETLLAEDPDDSTLQLLDAVNVDGETALHLAIAKGKPDFKQKLVEKLLNAMEKRQKIGGSVQMPHPDVLGSPDKGIGVCEALTRKNHSGNSALSLAVESGNRSLVETIVDACPELIKDRTSDGYGKRVRLLTVSSGTWWLDKLGYAFDDAAKYDGEIKEFTSETNKSGNTALHLAVANKQFSVVEKLLSAMQNVGTK